MGIYKKKKNKEKLPSKNMQKKKGLASTRGGPTKTPALTVNRSPRKGESRGEGVKKGRMKEKDGRNHFPRMVRKYRLLRGLVLTIQPNKCQERSGKLIEKPDQGNNPQVGKK